METVGTCTKYLCMVDPELMECVLISAGENPRTSSLIIPTADRILVRVVVEDIVLREFLTKMLLTQVLMLVPG